MPFRRLAVVLALPLMLLATSCSSDDGSGRSGAASGTAAQSGDVRALVAKIRSGVRPLKTSHFELSATVGGRELTGSGDETLEAGALTGLRADADIPGAGSIAVVVTGGKRYAKLPPPLATRQKPWLAITTDARNPVVGQVAGVLDAALAAASLDGLSDVAAATTKLQKRATSGGVTHYTLTVDPARLHQGGATKALGAKPIPVQLYLDSAGRPTKVQVVVGLLGQPTDTTVSFSRFDDPVTIAAPPTGQIAAG